MSAENEETIKRSASEMDIKSEEDDQHQPSKKARIDESLHVDTRFLIQSRNAGAIIGKGGQNINRLRNDFKASVSVPDCPGPERILTLGGSISVIGDLLMDIIPRLDDYSHHKGTDFKCEFRMLVHQSHAGSLIGRAGFKIKELRERTGANIKIFSSCCPDSTDRVVQVSGTPKIVVGCVQDICDSISKSPIKPPNNPYDPHNFDDQFANEYGGYGGMNDGFGFRNGRSGGFNRNQGGRNSNNRSGGPRPSRGGFRGRGGWSNRDFGRNMNDSYNADGGWDDYEEDRFMPMNQRMMSGSGGGGGGGGGAGRQGGMRNFNNDGFGNNTGAGGGGRDMNRMGNRDNRMGGGRGRSNGPMFDRQGNGNMGGRGGSSRMSGSGGGMGRRMQDDGMDMGNEGGMRPQIQGNMQQNFSDNYRNSGPSNSTQVSVPKDIAGAIIGKGGSRIKSVRADSGANVTIAEALPGSNDRIITISGSDPQIQRAQFLLQKCVKENSGPSGNF